MWVCHAPPHAVNKGATDDVKTDRVVFANSYTVMCIHRLHVVILVCMSIPVCCMCSQPQLCPVAGTPVFKSRHLFQRVDTCLKRRDLFLRVDTCFTPLFKSRRLFSIDACFQEPTPVLKRRCLFSTDDASFHESTPAVKSRRLLSKGRRLLSRVDACCQQSTNAPKKLPVKVTFRVQPTPSCFCMRALAYNSFHPHACPYRKDK